MSGCEFTGDQSEALLWTIKGAEIFYSLKELNLMESIDFSSDFTVNNLALILAKAPKIKVVNIE